MRTEGTEGEGAGGGGDAPAKEPARERRRNTTAVPERAQGNAAMTVTLCCKALAATEA